ncbi:MAG: DUF1638 domain-containing protein [Syntrophothermus sp.]|uniref:DUF1638 domain-containing protein n=1 Tax=Syntrophothermus sp. TaxID=2736299 RepID=UPI00257FF45B|nr:DUF1638 domain-containing protein [Syntrophothermus sp.]NSW84143.1 DUF1638 domain-containing protein [Syntrophothermus sp.]
MVQKSVLLVCESLVPEIEALRPNNVDVRVMEFGLHRFPKKLNKELRNVLGVLENDLQYNLILLGYGLCSGGPIGLKPKRTKLIMPRTHDCIALLLGSMESYHREVTKDPGTYYLTKSWIEHHEDPLSMFRGQHEWTKNLDDQTTRWVAREIMKNYTRIALINTGAYRLQDYENYARITAETYGLRFEIIPGSLNLLKKLLYGPWDNEFLVLEPGQEITKEMFL